MATIRLIRAEIPARLHPALGGLVVGAWAMLPPYVGPRLNAAPRAEFADHVVPGAVIVAVSLATVILDRRRAATGVMFGAGLVVALAGLWMTATHVPLLAQATRNEAPALAVAHHSLPGLCVLGLGVAWAVRHWSDLER